MFSNSLWLHFVFFCAIVPYSPQAIRCEIYSEEKPKFCSQKYVLKKVNHFLKKSANSCVECEKRSKVYRLLWYQNSGNSFSVASKALQLNQTSPFLTRLRGAGHEEDGSPFSYSAKYAGTHPAAEDPHTAYVW